MPLDLDHRLIDAVDSGAVDEARRLLILGASPSARKRVTLRIRVAENRGVETKSDTIEGENAMALAIVHRHVDVVEQLLQHGVKSTWWNGTVHDQSTVKSNLKTSNLGEQLTVQNPKIVHDVRNYFHLRPQLDNVTMLLLNGATVTDREMEAAKAFPDKRFAELVAEHRRSSPSTSTPSALSLHRSWSSEWVHLSSPRSMDTMIDQVNQGLTSPALATESQAASAFAKGSTTKLQKIIEELQAKNAALESGIIAYPELEGRISELEAQIINDASIPTENVTINAKKRKLNPPHSPPSAHSTLLDRHQVFRGAETSHLSPRDLEYVRVEALMQVVANFLPQRSDELQLSCGDHVFVNVSFSDGWGSVSASITDEATLRGIA
ncbi:hypothetical protein HDU93_000574 [Gonapodya sp. JEL0774]|nr:hypothetical protein HDU93_000574 [Gonapodya sp. JEL0774]